jgi:fructose-bisphosphate aldolase class II
VQASRGARKYTNDNFLRHLMLAAAELYPELPIVMHQDHGNSVDTCVSAIRYGFTSVMMDGSLEEDGKTPSSYEYNVAVTREVVNVAHRFGVSVEGELGCLGSLEHGTGEKEDGHGAEGKLSLDQLLTDPDQAVDFVQRTGLDALAVAVGTSHGAYKFSRKPTGDVLAMKRIEEIHTKLPNCHLVMHGSSSVPAELCAIINKYGGAMKETYGVPVEEIQRGIRAGVRKINVDTDNRSGHHRRDSQGLRREAGRIRPALLPDPGTRRDAEGVRRAHEAVWPGRPGPERAHHHARRDGQGLPGGKFGNNAKPDERSAQLKN